MQEVLERKDSSHDSSSAGTRTEQRRNGGASTPPDRATTCENGITHAAFQWEKQAGYISSPSRSRPTDRDRHHPPHPEAAAARRRPTLGGTATASEERRAESGHCALALISIRGIVRTGWMPWMGRCPKCIQQST